jgi:hypothetical protein
MDSGPGLNWEVLFSPKIIWTIMNNFRCFVVLMAQNKTALVIHFSKNITAEGEAKFPRKSFKIRLT